MGNVLGAGLGIVGQVSDYNSKMDVANSQRKQAVTQMNFTFQNYEMERQDAFDSAVDEITKTRMRASSAQATVQTALGEQGGQGRTAQLLMRNAGSKEAMAVSDIQSNYQSKSNEIDLNKEASFRNTQSYISQVKDPSFLSLVAGIGSTVVGAVNKGETAKADAQLKGVSFDWDNYWWHGSGVTPRKTSQTTSGTIGGYNDNG